MSLYNMIFGISISADVCLHIVGRNIDDIGRFRDAYFIKGGNYVNILTRTGGGNREAYEGDNAYLTGGRCYRENHDDEFDCTFAHFVYEVPAHIKPLTQEMEGILQEMGYGGDIRGPANIERMMEEDEPPLPEPDDPRLDRLRELNIMIMKEIDNESQRKFEYREMRVGTAEERRDQPS